MKNRRKKRRAVKVMMRAVMNTEVGKTSKKEKRKKEGVGRIGIFKRRKIQMCGNENQRKDRDHDSDDISREVTVSKNTTSDNTDKS